MKQVFLFTILSVALSHRAVAQDTSIFPKGEISTTDNHTGTIWLSELNQPDTIFTFSLAQAVYAPNAKLDWHNHPAGQYLLITEGTGYYQEKGKPGQVVHKGDVVKCRPGVTHWHGASPDGEFAHLVIAPDAEKGEVTWLQEVTDKEYHNLE